MNSEIEKVKKLVKNYLLKNKNGDGPIVNIAIASEIKPKKMIRLQ